MKSTLKALRRRFLSAKSRLMIREKTFHWMKSEIQFAMEPLR
jgi:hypothetical protein